MYSENIFRDKGEKIFLETWKVSKSTVGQLALQETLKEKHILKAMENTGEQTQNLFPHYFIPIKICLQVGGALILLWKAEILFRGRQYGEKKKGFLPTEVLGAGAHILTARE